MLAFCDDTGEFLAAQLRKGNAGSNTAVDHITVVDQALTQLPDSHRHGTPILVRADTADCTRVFLTHLRGLREQGVSCEFSVGWAITKTERAAITAVPAWGWAAAIDADGGHRDGAGLAELTGLLAARALTGYPNGSRVVVRRERPHPGAQLDAFERARSPPRDPARSGYLTLQPRHDQRREQPAERQAGRSDMPTRKRRHEDP